MAQLADRTARYVQVVATTTLLAALLASNAHGAVGDTSLISRASLPGNAPGDSTSGKAAVSSGGRYVAFDSFAGNLGTGDGAFSDVFVRDTGLGSTQLVSTGLSGAATNGGSFDPDITPDGRCVAFHSSATNLTSDDLQGNVPQVYVRDRVAGTTRLVSRQDGTGDAADGVQQDQATVSDDCRYVAFSSDASNLGSDGLTTQVYVRDLTTNDTTLASRTTGTPGDPADLSATQPVISADGRHVVFCSPAENLASDDNDGVGPAQPEANLFVRDLDPGVTELVDRNENTDLPGTAHPNVCGASPSADASVIAFTSLTRLNSDDPAGDVEPDLYLRVRATKSTTVIGRSSTGVRQNAGGTINIPSLSSDARYVAWDSAATNLVTGANTTLDRIYARDLQAGTTLLASRGTGAAGAFPNGASSNAAIAPDGGVVAFESQATNLTADALAASLNVFAREAFGAFAPPPVVSDPPPDGPGDGQPGGDPGGDGGGDPGGATGGGDPGPPPLVVIGPATNPVGLPPNKKCVDVRKWSFRLHHPKGTLITHVEAFVNGKRKVAIGPKKAIERLTLKKLPKKRFKVKIVTTRNDNVQSISIRTYNGCTKGKPKTKRGKGGKKG